MPVNPITHPERARDNWKEKNFLLTGRNLWQNQTQGGWTSASTSRGLRGQERRDSKYNLVLMLIHWDNGISNQFTYFRVHFANNINILYSSSTVEYFLSADLGCFFKI